MGVTAAAIIAAGTVAAAGVSGGIAMSESSNAAKRGAASEKKYRRQQKKIEEKIAEIPQIQEFVYDPGQGAREYETYVSPAAMRTAGQYTAQQIGYLDQYLPGQRQAMNQLISAQLTGRLPQEQEKIMLQRIAELGGAGVNISQAQRSGALTAPQANLSAQYLRAGVDLIGQGTQNYFRQISSLAPLFVSPVATAAQIQDQSRIALTGETLQREIQAQNIANQYRGLEIQSGMSGEARASRERGIAGQLAAGQQGAATVSDIGGSLTSAYGTYQSAQQAQQYGDFLKSFSQVYGGGAGAGAGAGATTGAAV